MLVLNQEVWEVGMAAVPEQARVLVVSASPYMRYVISGELSSAPDIFVVGTARTSDEVTHKRALLRPDLAVVDLESLGDSLDLQQTLARMELPVLALCSQTNDGAEMAFAALEAGATDVIAWPSGNMGVASYAPDLLRKVRGLARIKCKYPPSKLHASAWSWPSLAPRFQAPSRRFLSGDRLVVVSASTGGLDPLVQLLTALPADLGASFLVLFSLPEPYLSWFLRRLGPSSAFHLRQARAGLPLNNGVAYFAPQDYHLIVAPDDRLALDRGPRRDGVRPSADMTMSSLATQYGPAVIGVILSGVGRDGVQGALDIRAAGGSVVVQKVATCQVDETPAAVIEAGAATIVLPPEQIAGEIVRWAQAG